MSSEGLWISALVRWWGVIGERFQFWWCRGKVKVRLRFEGAGVDVEAVEVRERACGNRYIDLEVKECGAYLVWTFSVYEVHGRLWESIRVMALREVL